MCWPVPGSQGHYQKPFYYWNTFGPKSVLTKSLHGGNLTPGIPSLLFPCGVLHSAPLPYQPDHAANISMKAWDKTAIMIIWSLVGVSLLAIYCYLVRLCMSILRSFIVCAAVLLLYWRCDMVWRRMLGGAGMAPFWQGNVPELGFAKGPLTKYSSKFVAFVVFWCKYWYFCSFLCILNVFIEKYRFFFIFIVFFVFSDVFHNFSTFCFIFIVFLFFILLFHNFCNILQDLC